MKQIGERTIWVDCDVIQGDGGTRTAAITGTYVALSLAVKKLLAEKKIFTSPILSGIAAVSVGIVKGVPTLDLCYQCGTCSGTCPWNQVRNFRVRDIITRAQIGLEGYEESRWILLDYGDFVVHVFTPEAREFYRLDVLWKQAPVETVE